MTNETISNSSNSDFRNGIKGGLTIGLALFILFYTYSIAALEKGMEPLTIFLFSCFTFAAPAQFAVVDMIGGAAPISQMILVSILVNLRFFVLSLTMTHFVKNHPLKAVLPMAHFVTASFFLTSFFYRRKNKDSDFLTFFAGVATASVPIVLAGTLLGIFTLKSLPKPLLEAAPLVLPVYFTSLLIGDMKKGAELFVVVLSFAITPLLESLYPGWGVIIAATLSATLALRIGKSARQKG